jgi:hypothetical protein
VSGNVKLTGVLAAEALGPHERHVDLCRFEVCSKVCFDITVLIVELLIRLGCFVKKLMRFDVIRADDISRSGVPAFIC